MANENIDQVYTANPITSNAITDLMYFGQSPYGSGDDAAMTFANFSAQFTTSSLAQHDIFQGNASNKAAPVTLSAAIDAAIGSTQGDILYRSATAWTVLAPGTSGYYLQTQGAAANPQWATVSASGPWSAGAGTDSAIGGDGSATCAGNYGLTYGDSSCSNSSNNSISGGTGTAVSAAYSFGWGYECVVSGNGQAFAMGNQSHATGAYAFAFGSFCHALANFTWAFGDGAIATHQGSVVWSDSNGTGNGDSNTNQWVATYAGGFYQYVGSTLAFEIKTTGATTFLGTAAADNASSGFVGEVISSQITSGSPVSVTNSTATNITSISLTAGDWDVTANLFATATTVTLLFGGISETSATLPDDSLTTYIPCASSTCGSPLPYQRINVSTTTTVYLVGYVSGTGTINCSGLLSARRSR